MSVAIVTGAAQGIGRGIAERLVADGYDVVITDRRPTILDVAADVGATGHVGDVARFKSAGHFASYNGTAPIEASSGENRRHRLNPRGNRQLNYALHVVAITQLRYPCEGRVYYDRKRAEGKSAKEAIRSLKRQISNVIYRALLADARRIAD